MSTQGHGWVTPLAGGQAVARCGGPGMCKTCQQEAAELAGHPAAAAREPLGTAEHLPPLRAALWADLQSITDRVKAEGAISDGRLSALASRLAQMILEVDRLGPLLEEDARWEASRVIR